MTQNRLKAAFYRGGTSKAVMFVDGDLPDSKSLRDKIYLHVLGSPDRYKRQLNGMGGGLSSLSKVVVVGPSTLSDADLDYTFVQIAVDKPVADYGSMCGNMSAAVGPFAVDEGLIEVPDGPATINIHNTNTGKVVRARFEVSERKAVEDGDFRIPGVSGAGARIELSVLDPGGATTGALLPTGKTVDLLTVAGVGEIEASMVDATNPVAFVRASDFGLNCTEPPELLDGRMELASTLDAVRRAAAIAMGLASSPESAILSNPKVALIAPPIDFKSLDGQEVIGTEFDLGVRLVSMGNFHRAVTLTGAMCLAVAANIKGTIVSEVANVKKNVRIGNPSGILPVRAEVRHDGTSHEAVSVSTYRTHRRIMEGYVLYPDHLNKEYEFGIS